MAQVNTFTIPDARTAVVGPKSDSFNLPWYLFLNNVFGTTGSGAPSGVHTVLHGGGMGFSAVDLVMDTVGTTIVNAVLITQSSNAAAYKVVTGDGTLVSSGKLTVSGSNGQTFVSSAFIDATNAANISSGKLPNARTSGLSVTVTTASLTSGGATGIMTFTNGLLTAQVQAT